MATTIATESLIGRATRTRGASRVRQRLVKIAVRVGGVRQHLLTMGSMGCADAAGFMHSTLVGLIVTAASLLVLDFKIQG